jgi:hypothetical protein
MMFGASPRDEGMVAMITIRRGIDWIDPHARRCRLRSRALGEPSAARLLDEYEPPLLLCPGRRPESLQNTLGFEH